MSEKDELAEIDGIKPKVVIKDGDEVDAPSHTSSTVYKAKRAWDHYYCTCPAWRNQARVPVNARTCKHLRSILGDAYEEARLKLKNPEGAIAISGKKGKSGGTKRKKGKEDDEQNDSKPPKKSRNQAASKQKGKSNKNVSEQNQEIEEDDEEEETEDSISKLKNPNVLLAVKWDLEKGPDPTGWWVSEKLDRVRVYYDGRNMISRLGNLFTPPEWFLKGLPNDVILDGELFGGRGKFNDTVSIVKTLNSPHWKNITIQVFDVPSMAAKPFEERMAYLESLFGPSGTHVLDHVVVVKQTEAESREHVLEMFKEVEDKKGEGLMLRKPGSTYEHGRSSTLQKIKRFFDAEAQVIGHIKGKGKHQGSMGALKCEMASGKTFSVGTGFSDQQRRNPPKIGSIITYKFQELTLTGVPRFPSYVGEAIDRDKPKDAEVSNSTRLDGGGDNI